MAGFRRLCPTRYKRIVYQSRRPWPGKIRKFLFFLWSHGRRGRCLIYDRSSAFCWRKSYHYLDSDFSTSTGARIKRGYRRVLRNTAFIKFPAFPDVSATRFARAAVINYLRKIATENNGKRVYIQADTVLLEGFAIVSIRVAYK